MKNTHHLHIELTQEQAALLSSQAKRCGLTKRAYLVRLLEGTPIRARPSQEIKALRTEIHHIGNNINQIARSVNAGIAKSEDAKRGLYLLDQVYEMMHQIANKQWLLRRYWPVRPGWMLASTMSSMETRPRIVSSPRT